MKSANRTNENSNSQRLQCTHMHVVYEVLIITICHVDAGELQTRNIFFFFSAAYLRRALAACVVISCSETAITFSMAPEVSSAVLKFSMEIKVDTKSFLFDTPAHHLIVARCRDFRLQQNTDSLFTRCRKFSICINFFLFPLLHLHTEWICCFFRAA